MQIITNRAAIVVKPKRPYFDWTLRLPDPLIQSYEEFMSSEDWNVYLIENYETDDALEGILKDIYADIFEHALADWHLNEADWPQQRNYAMFNQWFSVEAHSCVYDIYHGKIEIEDD